MTKADRICVRVQRLAAVGGDAIDVLDGFLVRLEIGAERYGAIDLNRDGRDWDVEADEELADWAVYRALKRTAERLFDGDRHGAQGDPATGADLSRMKQRPAVDFAFDMTDVEEGE